ncbi:hypothetical protein H0H81_004944 [Sphagnurus paluster]|uniref:Uncharacterized protein n=1 Tax=Sphagnurus paluster TaxID=117069 RepID=A0A9P7K6V5_9AGAR|nr:hypothetical protein H0H81_004944 [Sphagnurus paluster]
MAPRRRCPTCGSRQWHKEPSSGLIACSEGHVLQDVGADKGSQNYRNEATEAEDLGPHALRKRALKSGRKKKEGGSRADPRLYHGARGRYLYFECLQLLLRKQVAALTGLWRLPKEFEIMCRDLWALQLELLPHPLTAEPYTYAEAIRDEDVKEDSESEEETSESDEEDAEDEEMAALLRANSDLDESSGEEGEKKERPTGKGKGTKGRRVYESPASTISVLLVACWMMRIPVLCRDFTRLIEWYELPYLDPIARQLLPEVMVAHLTKHNVQALSPYHAPSTQVLHGLAGRLSRMMYGRYGVFTPEANGAPLLWRVVSQGLGGTPVLYRLTKRLGRAVGLPLTVHDTLAPGVERLKQYEGERQMHENGAPEVGLIAAGIIVLKMVYGLDGRTRTPRDAEDVACGLPRLDAYLERLARMEKAERGGVFDARSEVCMGDVSEGELDAYLEFSARALGAAEDRVLDRYFPVGEKEVRRGETRVGGERLEGAEVQGAGLRTGAGYRVYRARDVDGEMAAEYGAVVRRGAAWTGVGVEALGVVVEALERRVQRFDTFGRRPFRCKRVSLDSPMRRFAKVFVPKRDKHVSPPLPASSASDSSGDASLHLRTPDDDLYPRKSWKSWLKSKPHRPHRPPTNDIPLDDDRSEPSIDHLDVRALVANSLLDPPLPHSPFVDARPLFPRSIHPPSALRPSPSLAASLLKTRLFARLDRNPRPLHKHPHLAGLHPDEPCPPPSSSMSLKSTGLTRWISRPCFEDRFTVFLPHSDGSVASQPVSGTALAVAALEYSVALEAMVHFDVFEHSPPPPVDISPPSVSDLDLAAPPSQARASSAYMAVPSPLRNEHNPPEPPPALVSQSALPAPPADPLVKRGVRFAEDDKDDVIPLGYVLRMKQKREEKARFLRAEQERRAIQDDRARLDAERQKHEADRAQMEIDRLAWEKERRAMDEQRRKRKYAEEVAAARLRRESARTGGVPSLKAAENTAHAFLATPTGAHFPTSASSSTSERNKPPHSRRHSRPTLDDGVSLITLPRREASDPNLPTITRTGPHPNFLPGSHSPGSSQDTPPSGEGSSPLPGTRSPSVYSSSSDDVRAAVAAAAIRTKRNSFAASVAHNNSTGSLVGDRATSYPMWGGSSHSLNSLVPVMPMMPVPMQMMPMPPFVMMDMPLLPPTPPFMMHQYPRSQGSPVSSGSGTGSSKGRRSGSQNSSRERVNLESSREQTGSGNSSGSVPRSASFPRPEYRHSSSSPASQHRQETSGGDPRRSSLPVSAPKEQGDSSSRPRQHSHHDLRPSAPRHSHSQPASLSRGSASLYPPSPWTGIPTQSGGLPNANAPPRQHSHANMRSGAGAGAKRMAKS